MSKLNKNMATSTGLIAALASSVCCIAPLISIIGGIGSSASTFDWLSPFRPYLIGLSVLALGYAFYQAYKPTAPDDCGCEVDQKKSFLNSKGFLWGITIFSIIMFIFPYYSGVFFTNEAKISGDIELLTVQLNIKGMTCESCENHVNRSVRSLNGVYNINTSYSKGIATIYYDSLNTGIEQISNTIKSETGYEVTSSTKITNDEN